jgi:hypothetical protein
VRSGRRSRIWGAAGVSLVCALSAVTAAAAATAPPSPTFVKTVVVAPVSGKVLVRTPGAAYATPLTAARLVPVGTVVDTTGGRVRLTSANPRPGSVQSGEFFKGTFQVTQTREGQGLVSLVLRDTTTRQSSCTPSRAHTATLSKRVLGLLRGSAKGHFRTVGRFSAATVLGTNWGVRDRCDGTLTVVRQGVVEVRDFVDHKTVVVRTGQAYLAKAP